MAGGHVCRPGACAPKVGRDCATQRRQGWMHVPDPQPCSPYPRGAESGPGVLPAAAEVPSHPPTPSPSLPAVGCLLEDPPHTRLPRSQAFCPGPSNKHSVTAAPKRGAREHGWLVRVPPPPQKWSRMPNKDHYGPPPGRQARPPQGSLTGRFSDPQPSPGDWGHLQTGQRRLLPAYGTGRLRPGDGGVHRTDSEPPAPPSEGARSRSPPVLLDKACQGS